MQKKKVTLSLNDQIYSEFQRYCEENAIMLSKKIELFMKDLLERQHKQKRKEVKNGQNNE